MSNTPRPLGTSQVGVLDALRRHGCWYPGKGWLWENRSTTVRILESLVHSGYVTVDVTGTYRVA